MEREERLAADIVVQHADLDIRELAIEARGRFAQRRQPDTAAAALTGLHVAIVENPDFRNGLSTSLKCGLQALPGDCDGAIVLLGDMPAITPALIDKLIAAFDPSEARAICVAAWKGKRGNPVLWGRQFFADMLQLEGDVGAKHLMAANGELVCEVEAADDAPLVDIDTPEALAVYAARNR